MSAFGPSTTPDGVFTDPQQFRSWLLTKAINAELSTYTGFSLLASNLAKVREAQLSDLLDRHMQPAALKKGFLASFSRAPSSPSPSRLSRLSSPPPAASSPSSSTSPENSPRTFSTKRIKFFGSGKSTDV